MMETQHQEVAAGKVGGKSREAVSPLNGARLPTTGRQKGVPNKVTRTIREAVEKAARDCHPQGLAGWLVERAQGSIGDRQIFAAMVNKAMPLQVQANVQGGVKLELSWLSARTVGANAAQMLEPQTQVLDLEQEPGGSYRIKDQQGPLTGAPRIAPDDGHEGEDGTPPAA
jgi:hypothetical protein